MFTFPIAMMLWCAQDEKTTLVKPLPLYLLTQNSQAAWGVIKADYIAVAFSGPSLLCDQVEGSITNVKINLSKKSNPEVIQDPIFKERLRENFNTCTNKKLRYDVMKLFESSALTLNLTWRFTTHYYRIYRISELFRLLQNNCLQCEKSRQTHVLYNLPNFIQWKSPKFLSPLSVPTPTQPSRCPRCPRTHTWSAPEC